MLIKKALLIDPPTGLYIREDRCQSPAKEIGVATMRPSIELSYLASMLEKNGCECLMRDYSTEGKSWDDFKADIINFEPDMLIINTTTPTIHQDMFACSLAKKIKPQILAVARGAHFLVYDKDILEKYEDLDIILRKENEITVSELACGKRLEEIEGITYRVNGNTIRNKDRAFINDLDNLPFPARHLVNNKLYVRLDTGEPQATIQTSRGCPGECIFCVANKLSGRKIRFRTPANICDEIEECINKYNIKNFFLRADTFTYNKDWCRDVCHEILKRNLKIEWVCNTRADTLDEKLLDIMKKSGCYAMTIGIESGNQEILDKIKKGITLEQVRKAVKLCKEKGIFLDGYFLIGFPWDNRETIEESIDFALYLNLDAADFFIVYPFPGTEIFRMAQSYGLFDPENSLSSKPYAQAALRTFFLDKDELQTLRKYMFKRFYIRPRYILKTFKRFGSPKTITNCINIGMHIFMHRIMSNS
ncbi:MAG: B12-binding domain-containing radical SAM protein [Candidatus Omnitrophica bacterium]|nr:B12-binding domain-containing radical SAM protein [Candidatus Omnitrophota bacterium]